MAVETRNGAVSLEGSIEDSGANILKGYINTVENKAALQGEFNKLTELRGYSAYDIAVLNGFEGSEEEWLASLKAEGSFNPYAYTLPVLSLTGDTTGMTKDDAVSLDYVYGDRNGTCTMKWQGSSSLAYPKKNYTIKFDNAFEAKEGWGEQKKYCLKANYIDHSHARNIVSCKLWGRSVKSRTVANERLNALPNGGAIDGFPIIITLNGAFHGLYTFNIPKDGWMFGMGNDEVATQTEIMAFDTYLDGFVMVEFGGTYTPTTTVTANFIKKQNTLTDGGRAYVTWDTNKITKFAARALLYDENETLVKVFCESTSSPTYTENPYIGNFEGDLGENAWMEPSTACVPIQLTTPFSLPVPEGHTVLWEFRILAGITTCPDGTLTTQWSTEAQANNTWVYTWVKTGIETSIQATSAAKEAIVCADAWVNATGFKAPATLDGDFELEYVANKDDAGWVKTSLNRLINACINSNGTDLDTTVAQYLDWDSAIDYYIHTVLERAVDATNKNYLLSTYDGVKWFFTTYDRDTTYGLYWDGSSILSAHEGTTFADYASLNRVMELIYTYKKDALRKRYKELRESVMSEYNVALVFENFCGDIPAPVYDKDVETWTKIPSSAVIDVHQILDWYRKRVQAIDSEIGGGTGAYDPVESAEYPGCYYRMVNGVAEWINPPMVTGIEYRTTERWEGKVLYVKTINCGLIPSSTVKAIYVGVHCKNVAAIEAIGRKADTTVETPSASLSVWVNGEKNIILSAANANLADTTAYVTLMYIKD